MGKRVAIVIAVEDYSDFGIVLTRDSLTVHTPQANSPKLLVATFFEAQKQLSGTPLAKVIAAPSK
jgi:hypothetical protein